MHRPRDPDRDLAAVGDQDAVATPAARIVAAIARDGAQAPSARAITICWISSVPSPIVRIFASR